MCEESFGFSDREENDSGARYNGREDLGNIHPGDGPRYKGRGFIQLTGRSNYETYGKALSLDLINHPEIADRVKIAVDIACEYWTKRHLNVLADKDDLHGITRRVNGLGMKGLATRALYLKRAKAALGDEGSTTAEAPLHSTHVPGIGEVLAI